MLKKEFPMYCPRGHKLQVGSSIGDELEHICGGAKYSANPERCKVRIGEKYGLIPQEQFRRCDICNYDVCQECDGFNYHSTEFKEFMLIVNSRKLRFRAFDLHQELDYLVPYADMINHKCYEDNDNPVYITFHN